MGTRILNVEVEFEDEDAEWIRDAMVVCGETTYSTFLHAAVMIGVAELVTRVAM